MTETTPSLKLSRLSHMKVIVIAAIRRFGAYYVGGSWSEKSTISSLAKLAVEELLFDLIIRRDRKSDMTVWGHHYEAFAINDGIDVDRILREFVERVFGEPKPC